jgi:hypothetical protein
LTGIPTNCESRSSWLLAAEARVQSQGSPYQSSGDGLTGIPTNCESRSSWLLAAEARVQSQSSPYQSSGDGLTGILTNCESRSSWLLAAEARVQSQGSPYQSSGEQSVTQTAFSRAHRNLSSETTVTFTVTWLTELLLPVIRLFFMLRTHLSSGAGVLHPVWVCACAIVT